eukprot:scaffold2760_cov272-Pinguiococcus_pyrenoidosus.AAC.1
MEPEASTTPLGPRRRIAAKSVAPQAAQTPLASEAFERQEFTSRLNTVERPVSAASSAFDPWNWSVALFLFPTLAIVAFRCGRSFVVASALFGIVMYLFDLSDNRALVVATATLMVAALSVLCAVTQGLREGPTFRLGLDIGEVWSCRSILGVLAKSLMGSTTWGSGDLAPAALDSATIRLGGGRPVA